MNWLLIAVAVLLVISAGLGFKKGLLKEGLILFGAVILLWLMSFLLPYTKKAIMDHTPVPHIVSEKVEQAFQERIDQMAEEKKDDTLVQVRLPALSKSQQTELIDKSQLPSFIKRILLENNNSEIYNRLGVDSFIDYLKAYVTELIVSILAYITTFILSYALYRLILGAANLVDHLPLARSLNHGLGGVLGLAEGLVILSVFFVVLVLFCRTEAGKACYRCIEDSRFLTFLYDYNPLMAIVSAVKGA